MIPVFADPVTGRASDLPWRHVLGWLVGMAMLVVGLLYGFVLVLDPYGLRVGPDRAPTALMDLNQRYMYPQLARSRLYDAAIFGTSTVRLIEPRAFGEATGVHMANLGMNAATPWEQVQLADLFLRNVPAPKLLVFGLDRTWCAPDADLPANRLTFRAFPPWLYGESRLAALPQLLNLKSLEIASRVALNGLGLMPERIRRDGYEVFTPPESRYDLARARGHIWEGTNGRIDPEIPPVALPDDAQAALRLPALAWLDGLLARLPPATRVLLVLPPIHVAVQPRPGSRDAAIDAVCKTRLTALGAGRGATMVDFRFASALTTADENYWDPLHVRLGIAARVAANMRAARAGIPAADGTYRILTRPDAP